MSNKEKIDIAAILKNCPRGMELDCTIYDDVTLDSVVFESEYHYENTNNYPIKITTKSGFSTRLTKYGQNVDIEEAKCVIFPKGKTTWKGFHRPFVDGDVVAYDTPRGNLQIFIFKDKKENNTLSNCYLMLDGDKLDLEEGMYYVTRFATGEEKNKLFKALKDNGYRWDFETNTLEKLVEPKFKVGDKIKSRDNCRSSIVTEIKNDCFIIKTLDGFGHSYFTDKLPFSKQNEWELVPNKFDISTLKTFDQVLVRLANNCVWTPKLFYYYDTDPKVKYYPFVTTDNIGYSQCIPYNSNEHLCRTTNNCDEFYRVWKE